MLGRQWNGCNNENSAEQHVWVKDNWLTMFKKSFRQVEIKDRRGAQNLLVMWNNEGVTREKISNKSNKNKNEK